MCVGVCIYKVCMCGLFLQLPNMGGASPNLALRHQKQLRSERSSSVCANDWRNKTADINSTGLSQVSDTYIVLTNMLVYLGCTYSVLMYLQCTY